MLFAPKKQEIKSEAGKAFVQYALAIVISGSLASVIIIALSIIWNAFVAPLLLLKGSLGK